MNKKFLKMNDNNNQLSLGNFSRVIKEQSLNKTFAGQSEIFCTLFDLDTVNDSTINNYCIGARPIGNDYKEKYYKYRNNYQKDKSFMIEIILNITSILDGYIYTNEYQTITFLNSNQNLKKVCQTLYNIAKNDSTVPTKFTKKIYTFLEENKYYESLVEIVFYIVLEKRQPIYIESIVNDTIENILNNTNISINDLENFLILQFRDGINYSYALKKLAKEKNPYACFELGMMEYNGEITGSSRYNKSYEYFQVAASYNHPRANYLIAKLLLDKRIGTYSKKDLDLAYHHLQIAVNLGSIAALNVLGLFYLNIKKDEEIAISYFKQAIQKNYVYAYNNLGKISENKKNYQEAFFYYLKSANLEESWACNKVGEMYRIGIGTEKDDKKAYYYYNLAKEVPQKLINPWSKYNLAKYFYLNGNYEANIEQNKPLAIKLLKEASDQNLLDATIELLYFYTDKYFKERTEVGLITINKLIEKIEKHPNYNEHSKKIIEETILNIKKSSKIDKQIFKP